MIYYQLIVGKVVFNDCELFLVLESINWFGCIFYDWYWRSKCFDCCMFLDFFVFVGWILTVYLFVIDVLWGIQVGIVERKLFFCLFRRLIYLYILMLCKYVYEDIELGINLFFFY